MVLWLALAAWAHEPATLLNSALRPVAAPEPVVWSAAVPKPQRGANCVYDLVVTDGRTTDLETSACGEALRPLYEAVLRAVSWTQGEAWTGPVTGLGRVGVVVSKQGEVSLQGLQRAEWVALPQLVWPADAPRTEVQVECVVTDLQFDAKGAVTGFALDGCPPPFQEAARASMVPAVLKPVRVGGVAVPVRMPRMLLRFSSASG